MGDDYGYFGSGSSGYAHYQQTFKSCFGGSSGSDGGHHNNEPDWSNLLTLLKIGVLIVVPLYWTVTALHIAFYDLASIEPITILIDLFGTLAFRAGVVVAVTFQEVDDAPDAEASAEGDHKGLKNGDSLIEKCHKL